MSSNGNTGAGIDHPAYIPVRHACHGDPRIGLVAAPSVQVV